MNWFTARDGTRFLVQTPDECARSLAAAFPSRDAPLTETRFIAQLKKECPPSPAPRAAKAKAAVR